MNNIDLRLHLGNPHMHHASDMRNSSIDAAKSFCILGVIFIHSTFFFSYRGTGMHEALSLLARCAVPFFFITSGFYLQRRFVRQGEPARRVLKHYMRRLIVPVVIWNSVYFFLPWNIYGLLISPNPLRRLAVNMHVKSDAIMHAPLNLLLKGTDVHLWFLNTLIVGIIIFCLLRSTLRLGVLLACAFLAYAASLVVVLQSASGALDVQTVNASHAVGLTVGLYYLTVGAAIYQYREKLPSCAVCLTIMLGGIMLQYIEWRMIQHVYQIGFEYIFCLLSTLPYAAGLFMLCLKKPRWRGPAWIAGAGRYSLGLYGAHMLFARIAIPLIGKPLDTFYACACVIGIFAATYVFVRMLACVPALRPVVR